MKPKVIQQEDAESWKPTWLYIKRCSHCPLLYFGKTTVKRPELYSGSGLHWKRHLAKHGASAVHVQARLFKKRDRCVRAALAFSKKHDIAESPLWANHLAENGLSGGYVAGGTMARTSRKKISDALKGRQTWNDGARHYRLFPGDPKIKKLMLTLGFTEDTCRNVSRATTGLVRSNETCKRISLSKRGVKLNLSDEQRQSLRQRSAKENNPMWGRTHTDKVRQRLSAATYLQIDRQGGPNVPSTEACARMSKQRTGAGNPAFGKRFFNDDTKNYLLPPNDKRIKHLHKGMVK